MPLLLLVVLLLLLVVVVVVVVWSYLKPPRETIRLPSLPMHQNIHKIQKRTVPWPNEFHQDAINTLAM
jgi:hypothetical protein